jgi:hypothetical protein
MTNLHLMTNFVITLPAKNAGIMNESTQLFWIILPVHYQTNLMKMEKITRYYVHK